MSGEVKKMLTPNQTLGRKQDNYYKSFNGKTEADILKYFSDKDTHCVKCKADFVEDPTISYPVANSASINLTKADGSKVRGVPYLVCSECGYENSVSKLLRQTIKTI